VPAVHQLSRTPQSAQRFGTSFARFVDQVRVGNLVLDFRRDPSTARRLWADLVERSAGERADIRGPARQGPNSAATSRDRGRRTDGNAPAD
jgi:hypothetical protein